MKKDLGQQFIDWLISPEGQTAIAGYKVNEQQLFSPNANNPNAWHRGGRVHILQQILFSLVLAVIAAAYAAGGPGGRDWLHRRHGTCWILFIGPAALALNDWHGALCKSRPSDLAGDIFLHPAWVALFGSGKGNALAGFPL